MIKNFLSIKNNFYTLFLFGFSIAVTNCSSRINNQEKANVITNKPVINSRDSSQISNRSNKEPETSIVDSSKIPTVTYCELIKNASCYDHKVVRVRAIYSNEFEQSFLYDSNCKKDSPPVAPKAAPAETWVEWDRSFVSKGDSVEAKLNNQINGFGRKDITLIGKFYSTNEESDPNLPNLFGHDNCCHFKFSIMRVESVHSITGKPVDTRNKFGERIKYQVLQKLAFVGFTLECLELSESKNTFKIKENDKELLFTTDSKTTKKFNFNGIDYELALGIADRSGRIAKDELIVSKMSN